MSFAVLRFCLVAFSAVLQAKCKAPKKYVHPSPRQRKQQCLWVADPMRLLPKHSSVEGRGYESGGPFGGRAVVRGIQRIPRTHHFWRPLLAPA